jgi:hypothetical protein
MGSPISSTLAETYLQYLEEIYKTLIRQYRIMFYKRYVDDILIIYDQRKTDEQIILHQINSIDKNLQFNISTEENNTLNYLGTFIHRNNRSINIGIQRKPTETGTIIHLTSNHPHEQTISAFIYYINRPITSPVTEKSKQEEWKTILTIAKNNGDPINRVHNLKTKLILRKQKQEQSSLVRNG